MIEIIIGPTNAARIPYVDKNNINWKRIVSDIKIEGSWWDSEPFASAGVGSEFVALSLDEKPTYTKQSDGSWRVIR